MLFMTQAAATKTRRTAPKEVRRQQLIDATIETIAETGISGTTMAAVTGRAGLSMGIVSLHFESKENLLKSTLRHLAVELRDKWREVEQKADLTPAERLWGIVEANFDPDMPRRAYGSPSSERPPTGPTTGRWSKSSIPSAA